jgi:hypothetical protein
MSDVFLFRDREAENTAQTRDRKWKEATYSIPIMGERKTAPIWNDDHFTIDSERLEILTYSESESR